MRSLLSRLARTFRSWLLREAKSEIRAAQQLQWVTSRLTTPIPSTAASLQPSTISWIVNDIIINNRQNIVELGAGTSTEIVAKAINLLPQREGTRFVSIEENPQWASHVNAVIQQDNKCPGVRAVHVPRANGPGGYWYDEATLSEVLGDRPIDLLVVDGPAIRNVQQATDRARVKAFFENRLADSYTIFIDDTTRPAERKLAKAWAKAAGVKPVYLNAYLAVIQVGKGFSAKPN